MNNLLPCRKCESNNVHHKKTGASNVTDIDNYEIRCHDCNHVVTVDMFNYEDHKCDVLSEAWNEDAGKVKKVTVLPDGETFVGMTEYQGQLIVCSNKSIYELTENGLKIMELEFDHG